VARLNSTLERPKVQTHEGAPAKVINAEQQLRRTVMACMLWEDTFYEDGQSVAQRIAALVPQVDPLVCARIASEARHQMYLRHVPLLIVREMARYRTHQFAVRAALCNVISRADEMAEFLAIYWNDGKKLTKTPLANSIKRGLADAFPKFNAYQLAKYNRDGAIKLKDVLFLSHPKPKDAEQKAVWEKLIAGTLEAPDTWEVAISATKGAGKQEEWTRLLKENRLGGMALIRNLRNMMEAGVEEKVIRTALKEMNAEKILPFRFLAAVNHAPRFAAELEAAMLKNLEGQEKLPGHTIVLVDISGSMDYVLSAKSEMKRIGAALGLAIFAREICETVSIWSFSDRMFEIPAYRGLGLANAIRNSQPHGGTELGRAVAEASKMPHDRLIVITDEQSSDPVSGPKSKGYMLNVGTYKNGVGYGKWTHIDGWSDKVLDFIRELEKQ
jgi:60 kDa SS-A/Ro ribonucleoprotein